MPRRVLGWFVRRAKWLQAPELRLVAILGAVGLLLIGFLVLGSEVAEGETAGFDRAILLAFRNTPDDPIGGPLVEQAMQHFSALGSLAVTFLITGLVVGYLALDGRRRFALLVAACALGAGLWMWLLKQLYGRTRPTVVTHLDPLESLSFPSGHSMVSEALYLTLAVLLARAVPRRRLRIFVVVAGVGLAVLVGISRIYLGVHYPTDVVGGWVFGLAWALTCGVVARWLGGRGQVEAAGPATDNAP